MEERRRSQILSAAPGRNGPFWQRGNVDDSLGGKEKGEGEGREREREKGDHRPLMITLEIERTNDEWAMRPGIYGIHVQPR